MRRSRCISLATSAAFVAQFAGCGSAPVQPDHDPQPQSNVLLLVASDSGDGPALNTTAGFTSVDVEAAWSSREKETIPLTAYTHANAELVVFAYEIGKGLAPAEVSLSAAPVPRSENPFFEAFLGGAANHLFGLIIVTAPIWLPILALSNRSAAQAARTAMHQERCCFVWIEDAKSGEVVAGSLPWEPRNVSDGDTPPASPSFEGEDLVNCVVAGKRRWAYRSQCS